MEAFRKILVSLFWFGFFIDVPRRHDTTMSVSSLLLDDSTLLCILLYSTTKKREKLVIIGAEGTGLFR